jgi:hypothetical protein
MRSRTPGIHPAAASRPQEVVAMSKRPPDLLSQGSGSWRTMVALAVALMAGGALAPQVARAATNLVTIVGPGVSDETKGVNVKSGKLSVTGTVNVGNTVPVSVTGQPVGVSGTVNVGNTVPVSGTVNVGNTVPVSGTVNVGNTVPVSGTVTSVPGVPSQPWHYLTGVPTAGQALFNSGGGVHTWALSTLIVASGSQSTEYFSMNINPTQCSLSGAAQVMTLVVPPGSSVTIPFPQPFVVSQAPGFCVIVSSTNATSDVEVTGSGFIIP